MPQPPDIDLFAHLLEVKEFILFVASILVGLVVWAWTRMEKSVDKCAEAIETHASNNEKMFDLVFSQLRDDSVELHRLLGEHESCRDEVDRLRNNCERPCGKPGGCS